MAELIKYRSEIEATRSLAEKLSDSLGSLYNENEDVSGLDELAYAAEGNASRISELGADDVRTGKLTDAVVKSAKKYCELFDKLAAIKTETYGLLLIDDTEGDYIEDELRFCDRAIERMSSSSSGAAEQAARPGDFARNRRGYRRV